MIVTTSARTMLTNTRRPTGSLEKRYPNSGIRFKLFYAVVDALLALIGFGSRRSSGVSKPRRILIVNIAHLGDVLIATSILPVITRAFPEAKIGFLVGSWSLPVVRSHPLVHWSHTVDHYRCNRSAGSIFSKLKRHVATRKIALREISSLRYDVAIDLFSKPNVISLLWQARIPIRIGYSSGGLGPLLTHAHTWVPSDRHISAYHADLLKSLRIDTQDSQEARYVLPTSVNYVNAVASAILESASLEHKNYVVVHMGTGEPKRAWPRENWRALIEKLASEGNPVVLTGSGASETLNAAWIAEQIRGCVDLCGKLDWDTYISIVAKAKLVFCVESVASHVAAATDVPCVAVWSGITPPNYFRPLGKQRVTLTAPVPCIPCYRGCLGMECVRGVTVSELHEHGIRLMRAAANALNEPG